MLSRPIALNPEDYVARRKRCTDLNIVSEPQGPTRVQVYLKVVGGQVTRLVAVLRLPTRPRRARKRDTLAIHVLLARAGLWAS